VLPLADQFRSCPIDFCYFHQWTAINKFNLTLVIFTSIKIQSLPNLSSKMFKHWLPKCKPGPKSMISASFDRYQSILKKSLGGNYIYFYLYEYAGKKYCIGLPNQWTLFDTVELTINNSAIFYYVFSDCCFLLLPSTSFYSLIKSLSLRLIDKIWLLGGTVVNIGNVFGSGFGLVDEASNWMDDHCGQKTSKITIWIFGRKYLRVSESYLTTNLSLMTKS